MCYYDVGTRIPFYVTPSQIYLVCKYQYAIYSNDYSSSFFINDKLHSWYDKDDKYIDVVNEMYEDNVLDDDDIEELDLSKEKDDFER